MFLFLITLRKFWTFLERAMTFCPSKIVELQNEALSDYDESPTTPLPIYQIRDNFYT